MTLQIHSSAFDDGGWIPDKHAKEGGNVSPPLRWEGVPKGARSLALVVEDPDAPSGTFRHWGIYNIPPEQTELAEGAGSETPGYLVAVNDFGERQYDGPRPPAGHGVHHYHFRLLALDERSLNLVNDAGPERILQAAGPHILEEARITGLYEVR